MRFVPHISRRSLFAAAAGTLWAVKSPSVRAAGITIAREPLSVRRLSFDPRNPPQSLPPLAPPEAGVVRFEFALRTDADYSYEPLESGSLRLRVDGLVVVTTLEVEIWTPRRASRKLLEHEEGHRAICERYYESAEPAAREAADPLLGRRFRGRGNSEETARQDAVRAVRAALEEQYLARTRDPCTAAQRRFDELTDYGAGALAVEEAVELAMRA